MGEGTVREGWYADPWGDATLRWWDGQRWTGHTAEPPPRPDGLGLARLLPSGGRIAVVDVETTGLYRHDRVVEIGIVTLDATGSVIDEFETLVDPGRDVGPTWIHGVTASMVAGAPQFLDVAPHVAARLDGAVVCAHNLPFDSRMLRREFEQAGMTVSWGGGLDTLSVTGSKLEVACNAAGIELALAHRAIEDARATAALLRAHAASVEVVPSPASIGPFVVAPIRIHTRESAAAGQPAPRERAPFVASLAGAVTTTANLAPYIGLLGTAVGDLQLTSEERSELEELAQGLGLSRQEVELAHRTFVDQLVEIAAEDRIVTAEEYEQLLRVAALLGVDADRIDAATEGLRADRSVIELVAGMSVCFTGEAMDGETWIPREDLEQLSIRAGLDPLRNVTSQGCDLLVAADIASRSGKAAKARKWGVPVASVDDFISSVATGDPLPVTVLASPGNALVCTKCGSTWLSPRRSANPVCGECRTPAPRSARPTPTLTPPTDQDPGVSHETLSCEDCGRTWERVRSRGRKPSRCPECA